MPTPVNKDLYEAVKEYANIVYDKPSAYKSGFIVKMYKKLGGTYKEDHKEHDLERWFLENWKMRKCMALLRIISNRFVGDISTTMILVTILACVAPLKPVSSHTLPKQ